MDARLGCGLTCVHSFLHLRIRSDMLSELPFVAPLRCCHALMDVLGPCPCGSISRPPTAPFHGDICVFGGVADFWHCLRRALTRDVIWSCRYFGLDSTWTTRTMSFFAIFRDFILFIPYAEIINPTLKVVGPLRLVYSSISEATARSNGGL